MCIMIMTQTHPLSILFYEHGLVILVTEFFLPQGKDYLHIRLHISHGYRKFNNIPLNFDCLKRAINNNIHYMAYRQA